LHTFKCFLAIRVFSFINSQIKSGAHFSTLLSFSDWFVGVLYSLVLWCKYFLPF
jgi:hypothetical protein